ncbi:Nitrate reductase catalytic subunit OS=Streptomyces aurantiogriseus OX=66870 GN=GCM10010251_51210 PE=3 SV=1 [Streptomyces aurantiogriseus]
MYGRWRPGLPVGSAHAGGFPRAGPDLDIFLAYAARMDFRDKDGGPLITWHDPESAFAAWQRCSAGRPCDYTGLSYDRLREAGGVQWPCTAGAPDGTARLYTDGITFAAPDTCESYGKDLVTGAAVEPVEYRSLNPDGKAVIKAAEYLPPHEEASAEYPLQLITGRTVHHFHTRTKTGRVPELNAAAPDVWAELSPSEASRQGLSDGDLVQITTPRGAVRARLRTTVMRDGTVFLPFHYGYWDTPEGHRPPDGGAGRAANETTVTDWDPVSRQPLFKTAAARVTLVARRSPGTGATGSGTTGAEATGTPEGSRT